MEGEPRDESGVADNGAADKGAAPNRTGTHEGPGGDAFDDTYWEGADAAAPEHAEPRPVDKWRRTTASGAITAALALGFRDVFEPERSDTVGIEQEAPAQPVETEGLEIRFDPMNSQGTVVVVHRDEDA